MVNCSEMNKFSEMTVNEVKLMEGTLHLREKLAGGLEELSPSSFATEIKNGEEKKGGSIMET